MVPLMKQKTFQFEDGLAAQFEHFCKTQMLVEKRVAAASLLNFMKLDAAAREEVILDFEQWRAKSGSRHVVAKPKSTRKKPSTGSAVAG